MPAPKVRWSRDGAELTVKAGTSIETRDTYSTLTVKGVSAENSGRYKVTASNVVDEVSAEFTAQIKGNVVCLFASATSYIIFLIVG